MQPMHPVPVFRHHVLRSNLESASMLTGLKTELSKRALLDSALAKHGRRAQAFVSACMLAFVLLAPSPATAATCSAQDLARAVDQSGASLRDFSLKAQPPLRDRMRRYVELAKIITDEPETAALDAIKDATLDSLDEKSAALLLRVDSLGRTDGPSLDCTNVDGIKTATSELLSVMKAKSDYMQARLDDKIAVLDPQPAQSRSEVKTSQAKTTEAKTTETKTADNKAPEAKAVAKSKAEPADTAPAQQQPAPSKAANGNQRPTSQEWASRTQTKPQTNDSYKPPVDPPAATNPSVAVAVESAREGSSAVNDEGYTVDEIREATRGFFGTVSTSLASVIEHAFKTSGRPTAYVLGAEGGGAFLAGLRFGKGTLYMRNAADTRPVYWHGPSVGTDFGASGSRTLFLIYSLKEPDALYRSFSGVDGSAYFVGGVGVTLLKGGDIVMAPIRSGLGLRVGANVGYVRFTDRPTWNPF